MLKVLPFRLRHSDVRCAEASKIILNAYQLLRVRVWQRPQQCSIDHRKDPGRGSNAQRHRDYRDESESRRFAELTQSELEIVHVIRSAALESDPLGWRAVLETGRRSMPPGPG